MTKVYNTQDNVNIYADLAEKYVKSGDLLKGLDYSFRAYECKNADFRFLLDIARVYADMGLFTVSNKYLFKYLDVAPTSAKGICYEELGINFYYLENIWASGYYFNEKVKADGYINIDSLDPEVAEFIEDNGNKRSAYFIAYPFDKADYSFRIKAGKRALVMGDYNASSYIYASIPKECRSEDEDGELALSYFLTGQDDKMLKVCHDSLNRHGDNVTAYCNLSNYYRDKKNQEKCVYYYNKALQSRKGDDDEAYKIATCAIELCDDITAKKCLTEIIEDRAYDDTMLFFRGIANYNLGYYRQAVDDFKTSAMIDPTEIVYPFYVDVAMKAEKGELKEDFPPFKYVKDFPEKITNKYKRILKDTVAGVPPKKLSLNEMFFIIKWGLKYGNDKTEKECFYILSSIRGDKSFDFIKEALMSVDIKENVKSMLLMTLITNGCKDKIGVVTGPFYVKVKPKKMIFDTKPDGELFLASYSVCLAKCVFSGIDEVDKIALSANNTYKNCKREILEDGLKADELASVIMCSAGINKLKSDKDVCRFFGVDYEKMKKYIQLTKVEKHDENN